MLVLEALNAYGTILYSKWLSSVFQILDFWMMRNMDGSAAGELPPILRSYSPLGGAITLATNISANDCDGLRQSQAERENSDDNNLYIGQ